MAKLPVARGFAPRAGAVIAEELGLGRTAEREPHGAFRATSSTGFARQPQCARGAARGRPSPAVYLEHGFEYVEHAVVDAFESRIQFALHESGSITRPSSRSGSRARGTRSRTCCSTPRGRRTTGCSRARRGDRRARRPAWGRGSTKKDAEQIAGARGRSRGFRRRPPFRAEAELAQLGEPPGSPRPFHWSAFADMPLRGTGIPRPSLGSLPRAPEGGSKPSWVQVLRGPGRGFRLEPGVAVVIGPKRLR